MDMFFRQKHLWGHAGNHCLCLFAATIAANIVKSIMQILLN